MHLEFKPTPCAKDLKDPTWKSCLDHWRRLGTFFFKTFQDFRSRNFSNMSRSQADLSTGFAVHLEAAGKPSGFSSVESIGLAVWIELIGHDRTV